VRVTVAPGPAAGAPAAVTLVPATAYVPVVSGALTSPAGGETAVVVRRGADGRTLHVSGTVPLGGEPHTERIAVTDNTRYFVTVLRETLVGAGIAVGGGAPAGNPAPGAHAVGDTLFVHVSVPLSGILPRFLKPSQNQIGEILLKTLGAELRGSGTSADGAAVVDSLLRVWGLPAELLAQADGSGLSRYNLAAPELVTMLLEREHASPGSGLFVHSLPVAGVDGTIAGRMQGTPLQGNVRAKTGTLTGVRALSGYLETAAGETLVFSTIVNHHTLRAADVDRVVEAALLRLVSLPPAVVMAGAAP
jgi:serine-type D-Ala-D-Ala carboxypeptidase/endopeptidase (penicillin-binding protein 4)